MGKYRKRFNEKARAGMLAKQAALKKARHKQFFRQMDDGTAEKEENPQDLFNSESTNEEILKPISNEERADKKRKLEEQLFGQQETKISRSKKKRLDKYIEHQLKREEKKELFKKLEGTKFDTSLLKSSKLLGSGGTQTKREQFIEAIELENQGRGDEKTREILYEEREVKDWQDDASDFEKSELHTKPDSDSEAGDDDLGDHGDFKTTDESSNFIDSRPLLLGGGFGFGFQNIEKVEKKRKESKKSYSWRLRVAQEERKRNKIEDEDDFASTTDEEIEGSESEEDEDLSEKEEDSSADLSDREADESGDKEFKVEEQEEEDNSDSEENDDSEEDNSEEEDDSEEEEEEEELTALEKLKPHHGRKGKSFKDWAEAQVRELEGRLESIPTPMPKSEYKHVGHQDDIDEDEEELNIANNANLNRKVHFVEVERPEHIQEQRMQLPVFAEEHRIMESIHHNDCVIICGETGSGKTTQVPQFLFESGYGDLNNEDTPGMIGITQPRRVAAVSMAERVSNELGNHKEKVAYQIRFDTTTKDNTAMKFMTDGVLLREMMNDFMLKKYSAIIIDEAHERNINTDILIGMLSRVLKLRALYHEKDPLNYKKLKVVIMSATLRVADFSENKSLFSTPPPILKVEARQYPVSIHFNRRTAFNYMDEAYRKACKIHQKLPPGAILIFMTGQNEITTLVKRLRNEFPFPDKTSKFNKINEEIPRMKVNARHADTEVEDIDFSVKIDEGEPQDDYIEGSDEDEGEEEGFEETLEDHQTERDPLYVLPLYSLLPTKEQMKVFKEPPAGSRLCIIATNVAETSLTIPGVRYVIDTGRSKERKFNEDTGVQSFEVDWISKASANQRSGRAGRTGPGHCYRLYSSAIYENDFKQFSRPEILRMPVESVILSMKSMGIDNIINFPFPTPPDKFNLSKSEKLLKYLGALNKEGLITELGRTMSLFPLSPRFAKMLIVGNQNGCLEYLIAIVSGLSVGDPFVTEQELGIGHSIPKAKKPRGNKNGSDDESDDESSEEEETYQDKELKRQVRQKFNQSRQQFARLDKFSDTLRLLSVVCAFDHVPQDKKNDFIRENYLRGKLLEEIVKLRKQISYIVRANTSKENIAVSEKTESDLKLGVPNKNQVSSLKQMITAGYIDQIAIRGDLISSDISVSNRTNIINVPYVSLFPSKTHDEDNIDPYVYIHPSSIISNNGELPPPYLVYSSLNLSSNRREDSMNKLRMKPLCDITGKPLSNIAKKSGLITYSKPLGHPYAPKNLTPTKRECYVIPRFGAAIGGGGVGWDLPVVKVTQVKVNGNWIIE